MSGSLGTTPLAFGGGNGCQTDVDTGLVLMGHRYYDPRTGRFLSQDPAGDGDNWYAYAGNSPTNNVDPLGLYVFVDPGLVGSPGDPSQFDNSGDMSNGSDGTWNQYQSDGNGGWTYLNTVVHGSSIWDAMNSPTGGGSPGAGMVGMFATTSGSMTQMRTPKGLAGVLVGVFLGLLGNVSPQGTGPNAAPEAGTTAPEVKSNDSDKNKSKGNGSKFSLHTLMQYLDPRAGLKSLWAGVNNVADAWDSYQRHYGGGSGGYTFGVPPISNPFNPFKIP